MMNVAFLVRFFTVAMFTILMNTHKTNWLSYRYKEKNIVNSFILREFKGMQEEETKEFWKYSKEWKHSLVWIDIEKWVKLQGESKKETKQNEVWEQTRGVVSSKERISKKIHFLDGVTRQSNNLSSQFSNDQEKFSFDDCDISSSLHYIPQSQHTKWSSNGERQRKCLNQWVRTNKCDDVETLDFLSKLSHQCSILSSKLELRLSIHQLQIELLPMNPKYKNKNIHSVHSV